MLLKGKKGLILGAANRSSIAWAVAKRLSSHGAELCLTYQTDKIKENVKELAALTKDSLVLPCDVTRESEVNNLFLEIEKAWNGLDFIVHSIAYAKSEDLVGTYHKTNKTKQTKKGSVLKY